MSAENHSKLELSGTRTDVSASEAKMVLKGIFLKLRCKPLIAQQISEHLVDTSLCGIESHGIMRALQYADQMQSGYMKPDSEPQITTNNKGAPLIDGEGGSGIPAMWLAFEHGMVLARASGVSAIAIKNVGHTGRHGAYADDAAKKGFLTFCMGGGNRKNWRQVAPYGGAKAILPTNPWCVGIPGGINGPVVMDFATSKIAGGWIYAARSAGALLPEGCVIDSDGNPTRHPEDYFHGGAILPSGQHKGYALALIAELIAEAMLGPTQTECHWFLITVDTKRYRSENSLQRVAEEILDEIRECPPAAGFERVEIPGERERNFRSQSNGVIAVPTETWDQVLNLQKELGTYTL